MNLILLRHPSHALNSGESCVDASRQTSTLTFLFNSVIEWPWPSHCSMITGNLGSQPSSLPGQGSGVWGGVVTCASRQSGMGKIANNVQDTDVRGEGEPCLVLPLREWDPWGVLRPEASTSRHGEWFSRTRARGCFQPLWCLICYLPWEIFHLSGVLSVAGFE